MKNLKLLINIALTLLLILCITIIAGGVGIVLYICKLIISILGAIIGVVFLIFSKFIVLGLKVLIPIVIIIIIVGLLKKYNK